MHAALTGHCPLLPLFLPLPSQLTDLFIAFPSAFFIITCFFATLPLYRFRPSESNRSADQSATPADGDQAIGGPGKFPLSSV
jgi:hypothetical protein